jgi:hypothetical protein
MPGREEPGCVHQKHPFRRSPFPARVPRRKRFRKRGAAIAVLAQHKAHLAATIHAPNAVKNPSAHLGSIRVQPQ